jgi:hypothetical protein
MKTSDKLIDRMDRLADLTHFPAVVNAGATANILVTVSVTFWLEPRFPQVYAPVVWTALVLCVNLSPVVLLRAVGFHNAPVPTLSRMDFFRDQHRFSDWVYLAASANMAFWILASWSIFTLSHTTATLAAMLAAAFAITFSPVLLRGILR